MAQALDRELSTVPKASCLVLDEKGRVIEECKHGNLPLDDDSVLFQGSDDKLASKGDRLFRAARLRSRARPDTVQPQEERDKCTSEREHLPRATGTTIKKSWSSFL